METVCLNCLNVWDGKEDRAAVLTPVDGGDVEIFPSFKACARNLLILNLRAPPGVKSTSSLTQVRVYVTPHFRLIKKVPVFMEAIE